MCRRAALMLTVAALAALAACTGSSTGPAPLPTPGVPSPTPGTTPTPAPGVVRGTALDTRGQPIAGATIWLEPALTTGLVKARTGADGRYEVRGLITSIPYYAKAWTEIAYRGQTYCVRLGMPHAADYDAFVPDAAVTRDFRWQLAGAIPDLRGRSYGGEVRLFAYGTFAPGDSLELTLTPTAPLVDGSAGHTITRRVVPNDLVDGIPHGVYTATATLVAADGARSALRVGRSSSTTAGSATLDWAPSGTTCGNDSGLDRSFLYWERL